MMIPYEISFTRAIPAEGVCSEIWGSIYLKKRGDINIAFINSNRYLGGYIYSIDHTVYLPIPQSHEEIFCVHHT